jgi:membrane fusion protein (multidrug efflux system)
VDVNGRAIKLRARIPNPDLALKPGLFARVSIVTETRSDAVMVPESAVVPDGEAKAVYVVEGDKAKLTQVKLGKRLPGRVEIAEGLKAGQRIVTTGQIRLRDGATIETGRSQAKAGDTVTQ